MTKLIRVENADLSAHEVDVEIWQVGTGSDGGPTAPDRLIRTITLNSPTQMVTEYIHSGQYLVIRERSDDETGA